MSKCETTGCEAKAGYCTDNTQYCEMHWDAKYMPPKVVGAAQLKAARRERQRLAWLGFMDSRSQHHPLRAAQEADVDLTEYNERWEQDD